MWHRTSCFLCIWWMRVQYWLFQPSYQALALLLHYYSVCTSWSLMSSASRCSAGSVSVSFYELFFVFDWKHFSTAVEVWWEQWDWTTVKLWTLEPQTMRWAINFSLPDTPNFPHCNLASYQYKNTGKWHLIPRMYSALTGRTSWQELVNWRAKPKSSI